MPGLRVCVSLAPTNTAHALELMNRAASQGADMVELRLDLMAHCDLEALLRNRPLPVLVTCRSRSQGGGCGAEPSAIAATLQQALAFGADLVDAEEQVLPHLPQEALPRVVVSYHDNSACPADLAAIYKRLADTGAGVVKLAVRALSIHDNLALFSLLQSARKPTIALAMGEAGILSRILAGRFGAFLSFCALDSTSAVAPGQVPLADMLNLYRAKQISPRTDLYGVIANPVAHSLSPIVHNAAFRACGIDAVYLPLLVEEPLRFLQAFTPLGFRGYSVTIPHKQAVLPALGWVEPLARRVGAVNTIVVEGGQMRGYNTDVEGALRCIEAAFPPGLQWQGARVLLVGAGGLARGLAYGLAERGARLTICNRTPERARALAEELGASWCPLSHLSRLSADVLLQTTSVGMYPREDECLIPRELLRPGLVVYDAVYNPPETKLLRLAREAGCITVSGVGHFIAQAAAQFSLWTGLPAPVSIMEEAMLSRLEAQAHPEQEG
jgi:3-dehydroquinate dehydratase/shikimate dehydrogenase